MDTRTAMLRRLLAEAKKGRFTKPSYDSRLTALPHMPHIEQPYWPEAQEAHGDVQEGMRTSSQLKAIFARLRNAGATGGVLDSPGVVAAAQHAATAAIAAKVAQASKGHPAMTPEIVARIRELGGTKVPPPSATDVKFALSGADVHKRPIMTWRDKRGKLQASYTAKFQKDSDDRKWARVEKLEPKFREIKSSLYRKLYDGSEKEKAGAAVALIIASTGLRPGNDGISAQLKRYGVTTLLRDHVKTEGENISFAFTGKSGQHNVATMKDDAVARVVRDLQATAHQRGGRLFPVRPEEVRALIPTGIKLKDFRTLLATKTSEDFLQKQHLQLTGDTKKDKAAIARVLLAASTQVALVINNTPPIARKSYIHPRVFERWIASLGAGVPERMAV